MDFDKILQHLATFATDWGLKIIGVLVGLIISFWIAARVRDRIANQLEKRKFDPTLGRFFANMVRYGILTGAILGLLGVFGVQTASFAAVIAAAGLAIGLAFQGSLSNFASGVMLLVFRPFKVGDLIKVAGELGFVEAIDLFTIEMRTVDNRKIIVPNGRVFGANIDNYTHHPMRRVDVDVGTDYGEDLDKVREVLEKAALSVPGRDEERGHQVFLKALGGSSIDWQVRIWGKTEEYWDIYQATIRAIKMHLDEADIGIPFPQMDVHFDEPPKPAVAGLAR